MCGIVGIVRKDEKDAVPLLRNMMKNIEHRGPDGAGLFVSGEVYHANSLSDVEWDQIQGDIAIGHTRLAVVGGSYGWQPFISNDRKLTLFHNGEIYNYKTLRKDLSDNHQFDGQTDSEVLVHLLSDNYNGNLFQSLHNVIDKLDGVYSIVVTDGRSVVIARDLVGVKQLYWMEDDELFIFASEKKALWSIGCTKGIHRLLPGEIIHFSPQGTERKRYHIDRIRPKKPAISNLNKALKTYKETLYKAVRKRIPDFNRVGIMFSGGVDSVLMAAIAREMGAEVTCYAAGMANSHDLNYAKRAADKLGLSLRVNHLDTKELLRYIPKVISFIEDRSLGQIEVAIPILASVEMASNDGQIVLLTGQGADELFGGYPWYHRIIELDGYNEFEFRMWDDLKHLYNETLEREDKITMAYGIELRVPYLDPMLIRVAFNIEPKLKIRSSEDVIGKYIHRYLASSLGIPDEIAWRPKEAAQHGAGIHYKMLELAEADGFDSYLADKIDYGCSDSLEEILGSSQRYGFKYDKANKWATQDNVQLWLDNIAYEHKLLNSVEQEQIKPFIKQAVKLNST